MGYKKKTQIDILKRLKTYPKPYFMIADLEKIFNLKRESLYVTLNRLRKSGILRRLRRGIYEAIFSEDQIEEIANQLYWPSYISFESALSQYGIMSQIPYTLTFATIKKSKKIVLGGREIEYRQMKKELFFGYITQNKVLIAEPEKALLDQIYLFSLGKASAHFEELDFSNIRKEKLFKFLKPYSKKIKNIVASLIKEKSL